MVENILDLTTKGEICESLLNSIDPMLAIDLQCSHVMEFGIHYT